MESSGPSTPLQRLLLPEGEGSPQPAYPPSPSHLTPEPPACLPPSPSLLPIVQLHTDWWTRVQHIRSGDLSQPCSG